MQRQYLRNPKANVYLDLLLGGWDKVYGYSPRLRRQKIASSTSERNKPCVITIVPLSNTKGIVLSKNENSVIIMPTHMQLFFRGTQKNNCKTMYMLLFSHMKKK